MESNGQMTPMSARRMQDKSELTPQSLKWQGLVGGSGANKSPKSTSMIGEGLKAATSMS